jgi:hypothetical protein
MIRLRPGRIGRTGEAGGAVITPDARDNITADADPEDAVRDLAVALETAGITLPSLGVETGHPNERILLVELGRVRPDVAIALAAVIRRGATP